MAIAYVGIGANLDDPAARVRDAFSSLAALPKTRLLKHSSLYRTEPQGYRAQPDFVNAIAGIWWPCSIQPVAQSLRGIHPSRHHCTYSESGSIPATQTPEFR